MNSDSTTSREQKDSAGKTNEAVAEPIEIHKAAFELGWMSSIRVLTILLGLLVVLTAGCRGKRESYAPKNPVYGSPPAALSMQTPAGQELYSGPEFSIAPELSGW